MTEESEGAAQGDSADMRWLLAPPEPGEVRFHVEVGEDVELSTEARQALEVLLDEFSGDEVGGFAYSADECNAMKCTLNNCQPLTNFPCAMNWKCRIADFSARFR